MRRAVVAVITVFLIGACASQTRTVTVTTPRSTSRHHVAIRPKSPSVRTEHPTTPTVASTPTPTVTVTTTAPSTTTCADISNAGLTLGQGCLPYHCVPNPSLQGTEIVTFPDGSDLITGDSSGQVLPEPGSGCKG